MTTSDPDSEVTNHAALALQLLEEGRDEELTEFFDRLDPVELAIAIGSVSTESRAELIKHITGLDQVAAFIRNANEIVRKQSLEMLDDSRIAAVVRRLETDDAADIIGTLPRRKQVSILKRINPRQAKEITTLLAYDHETAGGIMTPIFVSLPSWTSVEAGIREIRERLYNEEIEPNTNITYIYILDEARRLLGICSLRRLLSSKPEQIISEIMTTELISVNPDDDQEKVARLIAAYDLTAVPVVIPQTNEMLGIVTVDDILDVIDEEYTEDLLKLAGTEDTDIVGASVLVSLRSRLPWLVASWLGGVGGALLLGNQSATLQKVVALAFFMPVVFGMGGNVGSQSSTITVRGIATGELSKYRILSRFRKELMVGALLGAIFGVLLAIAALILFRDTHLASIVGTSIMITMTCAAGFGSMVPLIFAKLGFDPAVASGPFVTTTTDIVSITIYFSVASLFL